MEKQRHFDASVYFIILLYLCVSFYMTAILFENERKTRNMILLLVLTICFFPYRTLYRIYTTFFSFVDSAYIIHEKYVNRGLLVFACQFFERLYQHVNESLASSQKKDKKKKKKKISKSTHWQIKKSQTGNNNKKTIDKPTSQPLSELCIIYLIRYRNTLSSSIYT